MATTLKRSILSLSLILIDPVFISYSASAQTSAPTAPTYQKVTGYVGILHPFFIVSKHETHTNFDGSYLGGLPIGINLWKTHHIGFSLKFVPSIRAKNGVGKVSNVLVHPGILIRIGETLTVSGRAAFETSGRYGVTPVLNKTVFKNKNGSYFVAVPLPLRFGNNLPTSLTLGFQFWYSVLIEA